MLLKLFPHVVGIFNWLSLKCHIVYFSLTAALSGVSHGLTPSLARLWQLAPLIAQQLSGRNYVSPPQLQIGHPGFTLPSSFPYIHTTGMSSSQYICTSKCLSTWWYKANCSVDYKISQDFYMHVWKTVVLWQPSVCLSVRCHVQSFKWSHAVLGGHFYPSALWAGGVLSSRSGRAAAKLVEPISL